MRNNERWISPDGTIVDVPLNFGTEGDVTVTLSVEALTMLLEAAGYQRVTA